MSARRRIIPATVFLFLAIAFTACDYHREPDTLIRDGYDEAEMEKAIANARKGAHHFIAALQAGDATNYAIKAPIRDKKEGVEHFWLINIVLTNGRFVGEVNNKPGIVKNVKLGDRYSVAIDEISDWMFVRNDLMHGNYTSRVLFPLMDPDEVQLMKSQMAALPE